ncbi:CHAD domain-containing protein [Aromatoleum buckelii]|uniref:CHAD domain-containing protein n=1 Tax=Aromatoleum buckelii TaxID=200254 RepID=A0ABX1N1E2_9RHOO|nr:CHAD domain-containing protein [Aromatoleum buckelii]MCK0512190.1 CHAD domain-containing protein [Aromatoleum buckelii]
MSQEIELKLSLPAKAVPALRRHPIFSGAARQGNAVTLDNTYFDTPELALKQRKVALRIRRHGRVRLQTVKCSAVSAGGLTQRPEWEQPYSGAFDFAAIDAPKVLKLLKRHEAALQPVFSTRFRRETRLYAPREGVHILIMIDTGEVIAGEQREPICELELELVEGEPLDLLLLASQLAADLPLLPNDVSKAERGYRLHLGGEPEAMRAEASTIDANETPVEAFRTLASSCLRQWQANVSAAAHSSKPEFIHQLRVALRRLRSLLALFAPALPADFVADWRERLKHNADRFGDTRDLDVLYDEVLAPVVAGATTEEPAIRRLAGLALAARDEARDAAVHDLDLAAQGRLLIGFTAALHALPTNELIDAIDLRNFVRLQLTRLRKKVRRRFEAAADLVPAHLHALRIALKRLRYGVEFFAPLFPAKASRRYLERIVRAQDALGFVNDVDVARGRLLGWAGEDAELRAAAAFVSGWHSPRYARLARRSLRELEPLLWGKTPWAR